MSDYTPEQDERLVRYMAMATPLGYQSALTVVQEMTKMLATERLSAEHDRQVAERAWDSCVEHVEAVLGGDMKRAAYADNPYRAAKGEQK